MKKAFCFSLIVMFIALAGLTPVRADDIVVDDITVITPSLTDNEMLERSTGYFITEYLRQGGKVDFSQSDDSYDFTDFCNNFADLVSDILHIGISDYKYRYKPFDTGTIYNPLGLVGLGTDVFNFMSELPTYDSGINVPTPNPDPYYIAYIDVINNLQPNGFWFKNLSLGGTAVINNWTFNTLAIWHSWLPANNTLTPFYNWSTRNYYMNGNVCATSDIIDVNITSTPQGQYIVSIPSNTYEYGIVTINGNNYDSCSFSAQNNLINDPYMNPSNMGIMLGSNYLNPNFSWSYTGSLEDCFLQLSYRVKNVNIYVDGVPWSLVQVNNPLIGLGSGTYIEGTQYPVEYTYNVEVQLDIDDLIQRIQDIIDDKDVLTFEDIQDLIVDMDGQQAVAVTIVQPNPLNMDEEYLKAYGPFIPVFLPPVLPVSISDLNVITETSISVIPTDILEVFGFIFLGLIFVAWIHRMLE